MHDGTVQWLLSLWFGQITFTLCALCTQGGNWQLKPMVRSEEVETLIDGVAVLPGAMVPLPVGCVLGFGSADRVYE